MPASTRSYLASRRHFRWLETRKRFRWLAAVAESVLEGFWLGRLDLEAFYALDEHYFSGAEEYRTEEWNRRGLAAWERRQIERYFPPGGRLLVLAAGGGREVLALAQMGYAVDGFEVNAELVVFAEEMLHQEGVASTVQVSPRDRCPPLEGTYDGLLVGWGGYGYLPGRSRRVALLQDLNAHVAPGTPLLLSFWTREVWGHSFRTVAVVGNAIRRVLGREALEIGDSLKPNYIHCFSERTITSELEEGGFELMEYSTQEFGHVVGRAV